MLIASHKSGCRHMLPFKLNKLVLNLFGKLQEAAHSFGWDLFEVVKDYVLHKTPIFYLLLLAKDYCFVTCCCF